MYPPMVVAKLIPLHLIDDKLFVVLSLDKNATGPIKIWRLPSGVVSSSQSSLTSIYATIRPLMGISPQDIDYIEQLYTTEKILPSRTMVCINYIALFRDIRWHKGAHQIGLFPVDKLPRVDKEEKQIIQYAHDRLRSKTLYSTVLSFLIPRMFNLDTLQKGFEGITGLSVDRRNFRKKITALEIIKRVDDGNKSNKVSAHLYTFKSNELAIYDKPFILPREDR